MAVVHHMQPSWAQLECCSFRSYAAEGHLVPFRAVRDVHGLVQIPGTDNNYLTWGTSGARGGGRSGRFRDTSFVRFDGGGKSIW